MPPLRLLSLLALLISVWSTTAYCQCSTDITGPGINQSMGCLNYSSSLTFYYQATMANSSWTYTWSVSPGGTIYTGQGTSMVGIGWSQGSESACQRWVNVVVSDGQGCTYNYGLANGQQGKCVVVGINPPVTTSSLGPPGVACQFDPIEPSLNNYTYTANTNVAASFAWTFTGATILSVNNSSYSGYANVIYPTANPCVVFNVTATNLYTGCSSSAYPPPGHCFFISPRPDNFPIVGPRTVELDSCPQLYHTNSNCILNNYPVESYWRPTGAQVLDHKRSCQTYFARDSILYRWTQPGPKIIRHVQTSYYGCETTDTARVMVLPTGTPARARIIGPQNVCIFPDTVLYHAPANAGLAFNWTVTNGTLLSGQGTDSIWVVWPNGLSVGEVRLTVTGSGCTNTATITVNTSIVTTLTGPTTVCDTHPVTYSSGAFNPSTYYLWTVTGGDILSGHGTHQVSVAWNETGPYSIIVLNSNTSCADSDTLYPIKVTPQLANLGPDTMACIGSNIVLSPGTGFTSYLWSPGGAITPTRTVNSGTHRVTVTDTNGCISRDTINIIPVPPLAIQGPQLVCRGDTFWYFTTSNLGQSLQWSTTNGAIISGQGTDSVAVRWSGSSGTIQLVRHTSGCPRTATLTVNMVNASIIGPAHVCEGATGTIYRSATTNSQTTYQWSLPNGTITTGQTSSQANILLAADTSNLILTVTGPLCAVSDTHTIIKVPKVWPLLGPDTTLCSGSSILLTPSTAFSSYLWAPGNLTTPTRTITSPGIYTVRGTDTYGCQSHDTIQVLQIPALLIQGPTTVCTGDTLWYFTSSHPTQSLLWSVTNGTIIAGQGNDSIAVQWQGGSGNLKLTRGLSSCQDSTIITVNTLDNTIIGTPMVCEGVLTNYQSSYLSPQASYTWSLSNGSIISGTTGTQVDVRLQGVGTGYLILHTSEGSCTITDTLPLTEIPQVWPLLGPDTTICTASNILLVPNSTFNTYQWSPGNFTSPNHTIANPGTYTLTVLDSNGCSHKDTIQILPLPPLSIQNLSLACLGDTAWYSTDFHANQTLHWSATNGNIISGQGSDFIAIQWLANTGSLQLIRTLSGCQDTSTFTVSPLNTSIAGPSFVCENTTSNYQSTYLNPQATYQWTLANGSITSGQNSSQVTVSPQGISNLILTISEGNCSLSDTLTITEIPKVWPLLGLDINSCSGMPVTLNAPSGFNTYLWEPGNVTTSAYLASGLGSYILTVTDSNGCVSQDTLQILTAPTFNLIGDTIVCPTDTFWYMSSLPLSPAALQWSVQNGTVLPTTQGNDTVGIVWSNTGATGSVILIADYGTCSTSATLSVQKPQANIIGPSTVCTPAPRSYTTNLVGSSYSYVWSYTGGTISSGQGTSQVMAAWGGAPLDTLRLEVHDGQCTFSAWFTPLHALLSPPDLGNDTMMCPSTPVPLAVASGYNSYLWSPGGQNTSNISATTPGTYSVTVTGPNGCVGSDTIIVHPTPSLSILPASPIRLCFGDSILLTTTPGFSTFLWNTGDTTSSIWVSQPGYYYVRCTTLEGCIRFASAVSVTMVPLPSGPITYTGGILSAPAGITWQWYLNGQILGVTTQTFTPTQTGTYQVLIEDANQCQGWSDSLLLSILSVESPFSPTLSLHPNPAQDLVSLHFSSPLPDNAEILLWSTTGQLLTRQSIPASTHLHQLNIANFATGIYHLQVRTLDHHWQERLVIQR